jgi:hypothetical protein
LQRGEEGSGKVRNRLLIQVARWRQRSVARELARLEGAELVGLLAYARLWASRPRRWWWIEEWGGPFDVAKMIDGT